MHAHDMIYLSEALNSDAINSPGMPGKPINMSITIYGIICKDESAFSSVGECIHLDFEELNAIIYVAKQFLLVGLPRKQNWVNVNTN